MNKVTIYSHYFTVDDPETEVIRILYRIASEATLMNLQFDPVVKKKRWMPSMTFGFYTPSIRRFRFHIGQLNEFLRSCDRAGASLQIKYAKIYEPDKIELPIQEKFKLRDDQEEASEFILSDESVNHRPLLSMPTGTGKAQPLSANIKIPNGWTTMGNLKINDFITTPKGHPARVIGIFPQGLKEVYEVEFEDGRKTEACIDHLWKVYRDDALESEIVTTKELLETPDHFSIDLPKPEYGIILKNNTDAYEHGWGLYEHDFDMRFHRASVSERYRVISGFIDRTKNKEQSSVSAYGQNVVFVTRTSHKTAIEVLKLYRGLGGIVERLIEGEESVLLFKELRSGTRIKLRTVTATGRTELMQCIEIDDPEHLYITDDYIVTHNTVTALVTASRLGYRVAIVVLAGYVGKWEKDVLEICDIDKNDISIINDGTKILKLSILLGKNKPRKHFPKVFIFSMDSLNRWYSRVIDDPHAESLSAYGIQPWELMEKLGVGTVIFDEVHQHPHKVYRTHCFLHVGKTIPLSATVMSKHPVELHIQRFMYPREKRFEKIKMKKYIMAYACQYAIFNYALSKIATTEQGSTTYSHAAFEKSILANKVLRPQYINMIVTLVLDKYHKPYQVKDRCIVFVSTSAMAKAVQEEIIKRIPQYDTRTYLEDDPEENLYDSDIRVTTVIGGGTAHDIKHLRIAIQTISIDSIRSNVQSLGRLRELHDRVCEFYYLYSSSIKKQLEYRLNKNDLFRDRVAKHVEYQLPPLIF